MNTVYITAEDNLLRKMASLKRTVLDLNQNVEAINLDKEKPADKVFGVKNTLIMKTQGF